MSANTVLSVLLAAAGTAVALDNGFGRTPVMGFNTYNNAACTINQTYVSNTIQSFANQGFPALGYKYFQLDCGWQGKQRQSNGSINYDSSVFPNGISPLAKKAIGLGMQWAMYTDQGKYACDTIGPQRPGSLGYERQDALQLAGWNVAYMKIDNCYIDGSANNAPKDARSDFVSRYSAWSQAQQAVGIKGLLICQWGVPYSSSSGLQGPAEWTPQLATSFRVSDDIVSGWDNVFRIMNEAINVNLRGLNGPGHFADMDLLEVGNSGMTDAEQASHFAIWAMFKSALMVSTSLTSISSRTTQILQNKGLIAINQDSLGAPVTLVQRYTNDNDQYAGPLANGDKAILLLDLSNKARSLTISFNNFGVASATVTNLWTGEVVNGATSYTASVQAHGSLPVRLSNIKTATVSAPKLTYIEAESGQLANGATVGSCSACSGGKTAGYIGGSSGGTLTLSGIRTSQASQDVRFDYVNGQVGFSFSGAAENSNVRGASISVNGGAGQSVLFPLTGYNYDRDVAKGFLVRLNGFNPSGTNTIKIGALSGSTAYAPDFDRIGVIA